MMRVILYWCLAAPLLFSLYMCGSDPGRTTEYGIDSEYIDKVIRELSDDSYHGRKPFTEGEKKTVAFLEQKLRAMGVAPGNGDLYTQDVPLVEITGVPAPEMHITGRGQDRVLKISEDYVIFSEREQEEIEVMNSGLIFCGYGIVAPEYGWNDYQGLDMRGKTAVVLVNDPGFGFDDESFFKGNTMTYYGRWTYKYEEAERQGAEAILIIHETASAGYPWFVVQSSWSGAKLNLQSADGNPGKPALQGWITLDVARDLFSRAGLDLGQEIRRARTPGFVPAPMGLEISTSLRQSFRRDVSKNVIGKITGKERPDETIIYTAHWDHLGIGRSVDGDSIYNGAVDNASGTAAVLAIARAMASRKDPPARSVVFLLVTAEEQGLLGSQYYAENPIYPIESTVANMNMDALVSYGETNDLSITGYGHSEMDDYASAAAEAQGRYIVPDEEPEKGYFFRSDHFNFAKVGIPALYAKAGKDHRERGREYGTKMSEEYRTQHYHQPSDKYIEDWDLGGMVQDAELYLQVGLRLAGETTFPQWREDSEFRNVRKVPGDE